MSLKNVLEKKFNKEKIPHQFVPLPNEKLVDIAEHARLLGIDVKQIVSTLIYRADEKLIAIQKRADTRIDEEKLKNASGAKNLELASKEDLTSLGVERGTVPVVGLSIPYYTDTKVLEIDKIYGGSGEKESKLTLNSKDAIKLNKATIVDIAYTELIMNTPTKKRLLSGITPSGDGSLHIGNYLGAVRQFIEMAKTNETYLMVADLHALTTIQDKKQLQHNIETLVLNELALLKGFLTPEEFDRIVFFRQSDVPLHTEGQSILNNVTPLGLLKRAHAYKDKLQKDVMEDDINVGLFSYPMLMASDILLYQPDFVPVGKDQKQHIEITRDIADRFNKTFKAKVFKLPDPHIPEEVAVVLGTDGQRKMSKSLGNLISIFESEEVIRKQVHGTYTDPTRKHATDPGHVEGNMVFTYLDFFGDPKKVSELKDAYVKGEVSDVEVKEYLFESLLTYFAPARKAYEELKANPALVKVILQKGQAGAMAIATKTMQAARDAMGITTSYSFFSYPKAVAGNSITIDEFARVKIQVGKVLEARNKEGSEKLIRLTVDIGEEKPRIIFTGVRPFGFTPEYFADKQFFFITNLAYRKMLDEESQGMILAADGSDDKPMFISAADMPVGAAIR
jgi:tryptophanyl-tRNA synthetase